MAAATVRKSNFGTNCVVDNNSRSRCRTTEDRRSLRGPPGVVVVCPAGAGQCKRHGLEGTGASVSVGVICSCFTVHALVGPIQHAIRVGVSGGDGRARRSSHHGGAEDHAVPPMTAIGRPIPQYPRPGAVVGAGPCHKRKVKPAGQRELALPSPKGQTSCGERAVERLPLPGESRSRPFIDVYASGPCKNGDTEVGSTRSGASIPICVYEQLNRLRSDQALAVGQRDLENQLTIILIRDTDTCDVRTLLPVARGILESGRIGR